MPRTEKRSGNCQRCGTPRRSLHRDHILPRWKGGGDEPANIQWLCANCHEDKTRDDLKGIPGPNRGKTFTPESRQCMSVAASTSQHRGGHTKGLKFSEERRAQHSEAMKRAAKSRVMPPASEVRKQKVSESLRRFHAAKRAGSSGETVEP